MYLYKITNLISESIYIGITRNSLNCRFNSHKNSAKSGKKTPLYDAMRKYGINNFNIESLNEFNDSSRLEKAEYNCIKSFRKSGYNLYNVLDGGVSYFPIKNIEDWKNKLKCARIGRKPSLGMKHSDKNKELFRLQTLKRYENNTKYDNDEVVKFSFKDANKLFGISKTHYYRILKSVIV